MVLALAAEATPSGPEGDEDRAFPGKCVIEVQGSASTFGAPLQEPEITTSTDSITTKGAGAAFSAPPAGTVAPKLPTDSLASGALVQWCIGDVDLMPALTSCAG